MTPKAPIRVRIAPSPTGYLHLGTVRTALFNYLFAKKHGGKFVVRIEDTDTARSLPMYETNILEGLEALGLSWNEGPDVGGPYGPYRQSERTDIYSKYLKQLLDEEKAFWCFCSKEVLEEERKAMLVTGIAPRYGGTCRELTPKQQKEGTDGVIRLKVPLNTTISFQDKIRGSIDINTDTISDFVIAKSIEEPLYNFAVAVDDAHMNITHIIRGEDHISNTPKQILIQKALGFDTPEYIHLPLVLAPDRSKLSKRNLETSLDEYLQMGYLPQAMLNFLALIGWNPGNNKEILSLDEMEAAFNLKHIQKGGGAFNIEKLDWFNAHYIKTLSASELAERMSPHIPQEWKEQKSTLKKAVAIVKERMKRLGEFKELAEFFFNLPTYKSELLVWKTMSLKEVSKSLSITHEILQDLDAKRFTKKHIEEAIMPITEGRGRGEVLWPLRVALSGQKNSPGPFEIADALGKQETLHRITAAIEHVVGHE